jgi:hypothetical protein
MTTPFIDFDQFDNHNLIYFPCNGKLPLIKNWQNLDAPKKQKEKSNYGILCGKKSNICVVDIDNKEEEGTINGVEFWNKLIHQFNNGEDFPETPVVKTGKGGYHVFFKYTDKLKTGTKCMSGKCFSGKFNVNIDIRNDGGFVVSAGSVHPDTKKRYKFEQSFDDCDPIEMPEWLMNCFTKDIIIDDDYEKISFVERQKIPTFNIDETIDEATPSELDRALFYKMLKGLDKSRANNYSDWIKVCWGVAEIDRVYGWKSLAELIEFSKQSDKFVSDFDVEKEYIKSNCSIRLGSFWFWLKEDNPNLFNELYKEYKKAQPEQVYFYNDYRKLLKEHNEKGWINVNKVYAYFKSAFAKVDNGGNTMWFSRNKDKYDKNITEWILIKEEMPFSRKSDKYAVFLEPPPNEDEKDQRKLELLSSILMTATRHDDFPTYSHIDFMPFLREKDKPTNSDEIFNTFTGFPHIRALGEDSKADIKKLEPILNHIKNILCSRNETVFNYYIRYLAHTLQKPYEKPESAIIFISDQGLGKDIINHDFLKLVFGSKYVHRLGNLSDLTKNFNKKLQNKLITVLGELKCYKSDPDLEGLKGMITNKSINIEPKGVDTYEVNDLQRFIFHTNKPIPLQIPQSDRRFLIHKIHSSFIQSREYYNELAKSVFDPSVAYDFFKYLCELDISDFNPKDIPLTGAKIEIQKYTATPTQRFMVDVIEKKYNIGACMSKDGKTCIHLADLYKKYNKWLEVNGESTKISQKTFKLRLSEMDLEPKRLKISGKDAIGYKIALEQLRNKLSVFLEDEEESDVEEIEESDCE